MKEITSSVSGLFRRLVLCFLALNVVSCQSVVVDEMGKEEIRFSCADVSTRAPEQEFTSFSVWSRFSKDGVEPPVELFNGKTVNMVRVGRWEYDEIQYWVNGFYQFFAVAPDGQTAGYVGESLDKGQFRIKEYNLKDRQTDILFAHCGKEYSGKESPVVAFSFQHLFCKLEFLFKLNNPNATRTLRDMRVYGLHESGSCLLTETTADWKLGAVSTAEKPYAVMAGETEINGTAKTIIPSVLAFPMRLSGSDHIAVDVTYLTPSNLEETVYLKIETGELVPGKHYRFTLSFDVDDNIIIQAPEVVSWGTASGGSIILPI